MNIESGEQEARSGQGMSAPQGDPASLLITVDRRLAELLVAQQEISDRLGAVERQTAGIASTDAGSSETKVLWEETVRRFTGSIDVRLDILEDELGGLQDELIRLRQVASESAEGVRRRLIRRTALGQAILGVLIVSLFLMVWSGGDRALMNAVPSGGASRMTEAPRTESRADYPSTASPTDRFPAREAGTAVEMERSASAESDSAIDQATPPAAVPAKSVPVQKENEIDSSVESPTARGVQSQRPGGAGVREEAGQPNAAIAPVASSAGGQGAAESGDVKPVSQPAGASGANKGSKETPARAESDAGSDVESGEGTIVLTKERFAVQLVGYNSESWVWRFVEKFGISGTARYLHIRDQGRDMYVVLLGNYSTKEQAKAAIAALPPKLRDLEPLVRPLPAGTRLVPVGAATRAE